MNNLDIFDLINNQAYQEKLVTKEFLSATYLIKYLELGDIDCYENFWNLFDNFSINQKLIVANYVKDYYQIKENEMIKVKKRG